ncbi:MAG: tRNA-guanine(34) transglycosylase, partial [Candidatus Vogelbacteria bacterium CG10_big_fil_rev_8_21_14_0_10_45_14]
PHAGTKYQREALDRTHAWALRSLSAHKKIGKAGSTATELWGIVQGGREIELREKSAKIIGAMNFDGFGIGGSFDKEDVGEVVACVNRLLPEELPRHFLGIGEPLDILKAVENGCDMFDCVLPTRWGRNGTLMTRYGRMSIENAEFRSDFTPIEDDCSCYSCLHFTRSYLHHLFRAKEMLASTLATIHNLRFMMSFMEEVRSAIREKNYTNFKEKFIASYSKVKTS